MILDASPSHLSFIIASFYTIISLAMIAKLPGSNSYDSFAYDIGLLKDFVREDDEENQLGGKLTASMRASSGRKKRRGSGLNNSQRVGASLRGSLRGGSIFGRKAKRDGLDGSIHSVGSLRGRNNFGRSSSMRT